MGKQLYRLSTDFVLDKTEVIDLDVIRTLPSSSEGLAISEKTAVIDEEAGKDELKSHKVCKVSARYKIVSLP